MRMETVDHRHRPRPRDRHGAQPARGLRQADRLHGLHLGEARRARGEPRGPALRQEHPQGDGVRQGARRLQARRRRRRGAARRRDGGQPRPPRPRGRLHRRGPVGAARGARPRRRRAGPRVAREARRDAAPRARRSRRSSARATSARWRRPPARSPCDVVDHLPAQGAEHGAGRGGRARGRDDRRPGRRRPHAHAGVGRLGRRRRHRGPARADDDPDPRAHRRARLRPGPHRRRRTSPASDRAYDPVWVPWGLVARRLHDRRLLDRRDARRARWAIPYVLAKGVGVSRARYFPGATKTFVKLLAEPGHAEADRRPDPRRRGRQGALRLPRVRRQARRDARGPRVDGEHLLAADRRAVRADRDRRAERARRDPRRARHPVQPAAAASTAVPA